jgi:hypothetical protein
MNARQALLHLVACTHPEVERYAIAKGHHGTGHDGPADLVVCKACGARRRIDYRDGGPIMEGPWELPSVLFLVARDGVGGPARPLLPRSGTPGAAFVPVEEDGQPTRGVYLEQWATEETRLIVDADERVALILTLSRVLMLWSVLGERLRAMGTDPAALVRADAAPTGPDSDTPRDDTEPPPALGAAIDAVTPAPTDEDGVIEDLRVLVCMVEDLLEAIPGSVDFVTRLRAVRLAQREARRTLAHVDARPRR